MKKKDPHHVQTLIEFIEWAAQFSDGRYLFRGVPNDAYEIQASAYRRLPKLGRNNPNKLLEINKRLIEEARSLGHDQKNGQQLSDLELLAELQHFGAATCLIDFTRSALVALWFACQQDSTKKEVKKKEANGKVFAVRDDNPARFKTVNPELLKQDIDYFFKPAESNKNWLYQWEPKLQNNRIIAQHSVFVFGSPQIEAETECIIITGSTRKIKNNKQKILESLKQLSDITEASMYPDFDGFARLHAHNKTYVESNAHSYLRRGNEALRNNNLDDAISYYAEVIRLAPAHPAIVAEAHSNRGIAYGDKGDSDRAIEDYSKSIELKPDFDHVYFNRGNAYYSQGDYELAIVDFTKAVEIKGDFAEAYTNRGLAYQNKGDSDHAIEDHNTAIDLNPNYAEAYFNRGGAYKSKNDYDHALAGFTKAIDLKPDFAGAYNHRGVVYLDRDDYDRAIADFTKAVDLNPDFIAEVYYNRGLSYHKKGEIDKALKDYTKAIDLNPNFVAEVYYNRGNVYRAKGNFDRAIEDYNRAIELNPDLAEVYYNRGRVWLHLREWEKAKSDLTAARDKEMDIFAVFCSDYGNVAHFEQKNGLKLPADIAAMLTPPQ